MISTDIEQSKRVIACGINPNSADMFWQMPITISQKKLGENILLIRQEGKELYETDIPAWSFSALLALLPKTIIARCPSLSEKKNDLPPLKEFEFSAHFSGDGIWCNFEGEWEEIPRKYCIQYSSLNMNFPHRFIASNSKQTVLEDGKPLIFEDENPIEACIQAIEWITDKKNNIIITV